MSKLSTVAVTLIAVLGAVCATAPASAQTCGPLNNGRMADVFYEGTALFFDPVVEYREMVLTITGPCEDIVRKFGPKDTISFDIREIERVVDGRYNWQLRRRAADPGLEEELQSYRGSGKEDSVWWDFFQAGEIPGGPYTDSGSFTVVKGEIVDPSSGEERSAAVASKDSGSGLSTAAGASLAGGFDAAEGETGGGDGNTLATKDFVINDDLIVIGSTCVGFDCVNGETFGFDTIRLKENNLRIGFDDTSTAASFPTRNWQIRANSSANGGQSFLGFVDHGNSGTSEGGDLVFAVEGAAPTHALYVEDNGDAGFGTNTPSLDLHAVDGDSPGLRLEQDGSSGFAPQTWDIAGNETNFFVRDVTNGSTLPFRIRPGAPSSSIFIDVGGDVGIGTSSPDAAVDIERAGGGSAETFMRFTNTNGPARLEFRDGTGNIDWDFRTTSGDAFVITKDGTGANELLLQSNGDLTITGEIFTSGSCGSGCDLVFNPDYDLDSIEEHAAQMKANRHLPAIGPTPENGPFNLSRMAGGMLNELEKAHLYIAQLNERLAEKESRLAEYEDLNEELQRRQELMEQALSELQQVVAATGDHD